MLFFYLPVNFHSSAEPIFLFESSNAIKQKLFPNYEVNLNAFPIPRDLDMSNFDVLVALPWLQSNSFCMLSNFTKSS